MPRRRPEHASAHRPERRRMINIDRYIPPQRRIIRTEELLLHWKDLMDTGLSLTSLRSLDVSHWAYWLEPIISFVILPRKGCTVINHMDRDFMVMFYGRPGQACVARPTLVSNVQKSTGLMMI
jgi:hypothetical protein